MSLGGGEGKLFAVFDGHGGDGAAKYAASHIVEMVEQVLKKEGWAPIQSLAAFSGIFRRLDEEICSSDLIRNSGATAIVVIQYEQELFIANAGDARAVLSRGGVPVRLSRDHKASDPAELQRIRDEGGVVVNGRLQGVIEVTRSIGDASIPLCIAEPYVNKIALKAEDDFLIVGCDGVFDELTDAMVCKYARTYGESPGQAALLVRDQAFYSGSQDNITCLVAKISQ